jgi:hypothetical protein
MQPFGPPAAGMPGPAAPFPAPSLVPWRDNRRTVTALAAAWVGCAAIGAVVGLARFDRMVRGLGDDGSASFRFGYGFGSTATDGLAALLGLAGTVLGIVATWRLARAHEVLGRPGSTWGPGWAVGGRVIPLGNLVLPGLQLNELWKGSAPGSPRGSAVWKQQPSSPVAIGVIVTTIVGAVLGFIAAIALVVRSIDDFAAGTFARDRELADLASDLRPWMIATAVVTFAATVANAWLLVQIAQRQQARYDEDPQPRYAAAPPPPVGLPFGSAVPAGPATPPGWYADPAGRFWWRWWDGGRWTAHVSHDGAAAYDPPPG